jgi:hypothetical protein
LLAARDQRTSASAVRSQDRRRLRRSASADAVAVPRARRPYCLSFVAAEVGREKGGGRRRGEGNVSDFMPLVQQGAAAGESHYGVIFSSPKAMPRSRATIGVYTERLDALLKEYPGEEDFRERVHWLEPADSETSSG